MKSTPTSAATIRRQQQARERGAGLIEVTISLLLAGVGLLSLAQLFGVASSLNKASRTSTLKARAAQETIELLKAKNFSMVAEGTTKVQYKDLYNVSTQVENTGLELKKITVTIEERTSSLNREGSNKSVFVIYQNNPQAPEGPFYNALTDPNQCGSDDSSRSSNSGSGSYSSPSPSPTP